MFQSVHLQGSFVFLRSSYKGSTLHKSGEVAIMVLNPIPIVLLKRSLVKILCNNSTSRGGVQTCTNDKVVIRVDTLFLDDRKDKESLKPKQDDPVNLRNQSESPFDEVYLNPLLPKRKGSSLSLGQLTRLLSGCKVWTS